MSETYPNKGTRETLFAGHTPSSVGFDCKITNYFSFLQIKKPLMSKKHKWQRDFIYHRIYYLGNCGKVVTSNVESVCSCLTAIARNACKRSDCGSPCSINKAL